MEFQFSMLLENILSCDYVEDDEGNKVIEISPHLELESDDYRIEYGPVLEQILSDGNQRDLFSEYLYSHGYELEEDDAEFVLILCPNDFIIKITL